MDRLRSLFESLGFTNVTTIIASGNVVFSSPSPKQEPLERRIEAHLHDALGYEVSTFLRSAGELAEIVRHRPFPALEPLPAGCALSVLFLKRPLAAPACQAVLGLQTDTDAFHLHGREAYWLRHGRISDSKVTGKLLERAAGGPLTARNITTVRKLAEAIA